MLFPDSLEDHEDGSQEYGEIERCGVVLDIVGIECDLLSECVLVATVYLSHPRDPRSYRENLLVCLIVEVDLARLMWSWADERHISSEYIVQLGELINRESLDDTAEPHFPWVICYLVEGSLASIALLDEVSLILHRIIIDPVFLLGTISPVHISELVQCKYLSILSDPSIAIDDRS
jgi:hypothetical protein